MDNLWWREVIEIMYWLQVHKAKNSKNAEIQLFFWIGGGGTDEFQIFFENTLKIIKKLYTEFGWPTMTGRYWNRVPTSAL